MQAVSTCAEQDLLGVYKTHIIKLFNEGKLTVQSADWYARNGYSLVCAGGVVVDIVKDGKNK